MIRSWNRVTQWKELHQKETLEREIVCVYTACFNVCSLHKLYPRARPKIEPPDLEKPKSGHHAQTALGGTFCPAPPSPGAQRGGGDSLCTVDPTLDAFRT